MTTDAALRRIRRDLTLARAIKILLLAVALVGFVLQFIVPQVGNLLLYGPLALWVWLFFLSFRHARLLLLAPSRIAAGELDEAEEAIDHSIRAFSLVASTKLMAVHHLAQLRAAQKRPREALLLCQTLLAQRRVPRSLRNGAALLLGQSAIETSDLPAAYESLNRLAGRQLNLRESIKKLQIELDYGSRVDAWGTMLDQWPAKLTVIELLPALEAARAQALLAVAADALRQPQLRDWLLARVALLADAAVLIRQRPLLARVLRAA